MVKGKILPTMLLFAAISAKTGYAEDYRSFLYDGQRLADSCSNKQSTPNRKKTYWEGEQTKRSVYSTLQYLGLEMTIKFLTFYTRHFDFTEEEYHNLGKGLIGNYCSPNITVMSRKTLKKKWIASYHRPSGELPDLSKGDLFKNFSPLFVDPEKIRKREFALTVELFKAFCSWGNDTGDARLMVPLIRHSAIMAYAFRNLTHTHLKWDHVSKELLYKTDPTAVSISCQNRICRLGHQQNYNREELNQLYCKYFRDVDYYKGTRTPPKIRNKIKNLRPSNSRLMANHFISLLTSTQDIYLYAESISEIDRFSRMPMETVLKNWLIGNKHGAISPHFLYEERLTLNPVPTPSSGKDPFHITFQVDFGEWDRAVYQGGKVSKVFQLDIFNNILATARRIDNKTPTQTLPYLKKMLAYPIGTLHSHIPHLPVSVQEWKRIVIKSLISLIRSNKKTFHHGDARQKITIPVTIQYSPFALQYIHRT